MATKKKLNTKFIALVAGVLAVGLAVVAGIVLLQIRADPTRFIRKGDALMAEGRPDKAASQYMRAIGKAPFEMAYYDKTIDALESIRPETDFKAIEEFNKLMAVVLAKAESAAPQDGRSAREVRREALARGLDEVRIIVSGAETADLAMRERRYGDLARRFQLVDNAMRRLPPDQQDPRMAAAVRAAMVESAWRTALLQTDSQWAESEEKVREAIELDPTFVPNWYGLLRGQLDRVGQALVANGPSAATRLLDADGGFRETLGKAREALESVPAPEIDLLEIELGQIALYAGSVGDASNAIVDAAEPDGLLPLVEALDDFSILPAWEARLRLDEIRAASLALARRAPQVKLDAETLGAWREPGAELFSAAISNLVDLDPDDARSLMLSLLALEILEEEDLVLGTRAEILEQAGSATMEKVGFAALMVPSLRRTSARKQFDLALGEAIESRRNEEPLDDAQLKAIEDGLAGVEREFGSTPDGEPSPDVIKCRLMKFAYLGNEARLTGDQEEAATQFRAASRAASRLREMPEVALDGRTLDAALLVAEARGEYGQALALYTQGVASNPALAEDLEVRLRVVNMLANAGRLEEAVGLIPSLEQEAITQGDDEMLVRLGQLSDRIRRIDSGVQLADYKGADLLAKESEAALRGDVDERRRLLDRVIGDPEVVDVIRVQALLRRGSIEAVEGDMATARTFAQKVLDIDPRNSIARLMMRADSATGSLDRIRLLAEDSTEDPELQSVAIAGMIRGRLTSSSVRPDERRELAAERDRLFAELRGLDDPSVDTLRLLCTVELDEGRLASAEALAARLAEREGAATSQTILLQARILSEAGRLDEAIALVREAIDDQGLGTDGMFVVLGDLHTQRGERQAATEAYQRAFSLAPNRWLNALQLARSLLAEGRAQEALPVLRAARDSGRQAPAFLDNWLLQEMRAGNYGVAIRERQRRYELAPTDFRNASALVVLLMQSPIGRVDVVWTEDEIRKAGRRGVKAGEQMFDPATWSRLPEGDRQKLVLMTQENRIARAQRIIDRMRELDSSDPQVVTAATGFLRERPGAADGPSEARALVDETVGAVRARLESLAEGEERVNLELRLARLLAIQGDLALRGRDLESAKAYFDEAVTLEGDRSSELDAIASSAYIGASRLDEAAPHQARLLAEQEAAGTPLATRREIARRLVEIYVSIEDLAAAEPVVDAYFRGADPTVADLMSLGAFSFGKADVARRNRKSGEDTEYLDLLQEAEDHYDRAFALRADDYSIDFSRARIATYRWKWADDDERPALYDRLRALASEIASRHANNWTARKGLVEVLRSPSGGGVDREETFEQRKKEANAQVRGYLEMSPSDDAARGLLIDLLTIDGDLPQALDLAQAALDADPTSRTWASRVGKLRADLQQFDEAARQFGLLFEQTGNENYLRLQTMALMERKPPRAGQVIDLARANGGNFAKDPFLTGMYAAAMATTGRRDLALRNYESTYRNLVRKIESGDLDQRGAWRERGQLSASLTKLFPPTEAGAEDLAAFLDSISGGAPGVADLLQLASAWQLVIDAEETAAREAGRPVDQELFDRCRQASIGGLRRATVVEPEHPETALAYLRLGLLLQAAEDCDGAVEAFERGVELRPEAPDALNNLAFLIWDCGGDLDRALGLAEEAVDARPESPEFRDTLGAILATLASRASDPERQAALRQQAKDQLQQAARAGDSPMPYIRLAELEIEGGRMEAARNALIRAGDRDPSAEQEARIDELIQKLGSNA